MYGYGTELASNSFYFANRRFEPEGEVTAGEC